MTVTFNEIWWLTPLCLLGSGVTTWMEYRYLSNGATTSLNGSVDPLSGTGGLSKCTGAVLLLGPLILLVFLLAYEVAFGADMSSGQAVYTSNREEFLTALAVFYRVGALVYGGGPVVVPLLLSQLVPLGLLTRHQFLLG